MASLVSPTGRVANLQERPSMFGRLRLARAISLVSLSTVVLAGSPAWAQKEAGTETRAKNRLIEEVVVMAQKRAEDAQDVPISLSAFSEQKLDAMGIDDPKDLAQFTPGMYYGQTVNFAVIYIRGVGSDAFLPDSDPSVATYIDGIYYPFANGQSQAFGAVERVEVLKGRRVPCLVGILPVVPLILSPSHRVWSLRPRSWRAKRALTVPIFACMEAPQ